VRSNRLTTAARDTKGRIGNGGVITLRPPAKINISLVVFGRRPDGYHDLHTVMATVDMHDDLTIRPGATQGLQLRCTGYDVPEGSDNLVFQAAHLLSQYAKKSLALEVHLHKRIPSGAGLGGASSDAAMCLLGLNHLWDLNLSTEELSPLAAQLGSDVSFFLHTPTALCTGRGEIVKKLPHHCRRSVLLIIPDISVSTARVYENFQYHSSRSEEDLRRVNYFMRLGDLDGLITQGINSLTGTTMNLFPALRKLRDKIEALGIGPVIMSGSGSCMFVTSESAGQVSLWAQAIQKKSLAKVKIVSFHDHAEPFLEVHHADIRD